MSLTSVADYIANVSHKAKQNERSLLCVKGMSSNELYVLEANATTGRLPVEAIQAVLSMVGFDRYNIADESDITDSAYTEITASVAANVQEIQIFNSAGTLYLALGADGSETDLLIIPPGGGTFRIDDIDSGDRVTVKSLSGTLTSGEIIINYLG